MGGVVAYPTETVYGLGCDPLNFTAIQKLLALKQRPMKKGLILVAAELEHLLPYIDINDAKHLKKLAQVRTNQAVSWVTPASPHTPGWLTGEHCGIAVRISHHPITAKLCRAFNGAIVSTSANPAGLAPSGNALKVRYYFGSQIDAIISSQTNPNARPSEIRDLISDKVLRS